jgi:hypothetical protein
MSRTRDTPMVTLRDALELAAAEVRKAEQALEAARDRHDRLVVEALDSGATFREMAGELGTSAATVQRRYGLKGHRSALDRPAPGSTDA